MLVGTRSGAMPLGIMEHLEVGIYSNVSKKEVSESGEAGIENEDLEPPPPLSVTLQPGAPRIESVSSTSAIIAWDYLSLPSELPGATTLGYTLELVGSEEHRVPLQQRHAQLCPVC